MPSLPAYLPFYLGGDLSGGTATIMDHVSNPLPTPATASMLGWSDPLSDGETLELKMYLFIISSLRQMDQDQGDLFIKRLFDGPQAIWEATNVRAHSVKDLWSVTDCPDRFLPYLKNIVGWTSAYDSITNKLSYAALRRLIGNSVAFWKTRGTDPSTLGIISQVTGAGARIVNWFDYRWVLDETDPSHEGDGNDPWIISVGDTNEYTIKIVDDGTLDRELAIELLKLTRPAGERIEVVWMDSLDGFDTDGDLTRWGDPIALQEVDQAGDDPVVEDGRLYWVANDHLTFLPSTASAAAQVCITARVRGVFGGLVFNYVDADNFHFVANGGDSMIVATVVAGVQTTPTPVYGESPYLFPFDLATDAWYTLRLVTTVDDATAPTLLHVSVYIEGVLASRFELSDHVSGGLYGLLSSVFGSLTFECDDFEAIRLPSNNSYIDINT